MANDPEPGNENAGTQDRPLSEGWSGGEELPTPTIEQPDGPPGTFKRGLADLEDVPIASIEMDKENPGVEKNPPAHSDGGSETG